MSWWQLGSAANVTVSLAYLAIAFFVLRGLRSTGQLGRNPLALATGLIFLSCGVGHGLHAYHLLAPMADGMGGMRASWTPEIAVWDALTACVAVTYLSLRRRYSQLLNTPEMFRDELERRTSAEVREMVEELPHGVLLLDAQGGVHHVNQAARTLLDDVELDAEYLLRVGVGDDGRRMIELARSRATPADDVQVTLPTASAGARVLCLAARALDGTGPPPHRVLVSVRDVTEDHRLRQALEASENQHRTIVESLNEGLVLHQLDGQITASNRQAAELLGVPVDQMLGRDSLDARWRAVREDGTSWPGEEHPVPETLRTGQAVGPVTMGIHTPEGELRWLAVNAIPIHEDGELTSAVCSFVDVTARKDAEQALQASEAQTRATLEGLTEGVLFYDEHLVRRSINEAGRAIIDPGVGADDLLGATAGDGLEAVDVDGAPLPAERWPVAVVNRTGEPVTDFRMGMRRPGGALRWVSCNARPLDRPSGPWPVVVSFTDITGRLVHERAIVEAEQRVRSTFDAAPIGMRLAALDGTLLEANQALADILGCRAKELIGRNWAEISHPDDLAEQREGERRLVTEDLASFRMEKRFLHAAGHVVWAQLDLTLLRDADGEPAGIVGQIQDISERRNHEAQLRHLADHDALTGLLNRRGFQRELERHVAQFERYGSPGALLMLDLDHFKYVNDTLGHKAGDELIVVVADLLRARLRKTDVIARLGGDEFAVLLPRGTSEDGVRAADSFMHALRERQEELPALGRLRLSASAGVATIGSVAMTADELLVNADLAMYDAKEAGRDQVCSYADGQHEQPRIRARTTWMERINAALEHDKFSLFAQPIVDLGSDEVVMHELLLRMHGDSGDLIPPATFLYIAERFELIQEIDCWVVDHACELLHRSAEAGRTTVLTVNVSAKSLNQPDRLLAHLSAALHRTGADPADLVVEITETAAVTQIHHARAFAQDLQAMGCRLAIDDFGAGFGSFYYLKHLPFDFLKIDGEFVTHARTSRPDALIIRALRDMAHGLERKVIAEYCADQETLDYLREEGIDFGQGYHLGRPAPAERMLLLQPVE